MLGGYHVQEEDADTDADASTSEGIFVADTANDVNVGDVVRIQGTVAEVFDVTTLNNSDSGCCLFWWRKRHAGFL